MRDDDMHLGKPLRLGEAIDRLGFDRDVRKFRRRLLAAERFTGRVILTRIGSKGHVTYLVTMRALRRYFPEWFSDEIERAHQRRRDAVADRISRQLREQEDLISDQAESFTHLAKKTVAIEDRLRKLEARWYGLAKPTQQSRGRPRGKAGAG